MRSGDHGCPDPPPGEPAFDLLRAVFDSVKDAIVVIDERGVIESVNRATESLFGWPAAELVGRSVSLLMPEPHASAHDGYIQRYLRTGQTRIIGKGREAEARRRDGSLFPVDLTATEMRLGSRRGFVGVIRDITERKNIEAESDHLQRQLLQAQKLEAVGHLTGGLAHDFNNVLAAILGNITLAIDDGKAVMPASAIECLRDAQQAAERGRDLVAKMLAFARKGQGRPRSIDSGPAIREAAKMLGSVLPSSIHLVVDAPDSPLPIRADPVELTQVLTNLCLNSRDAIAEHGRIEVRLRRTSVNGDRCASCSDLVSGDAVEVCVQDDGGGIPADVLHRVFDPFFTTKPVGKGSGLGLSVVHGIVHDNGGHLLLESQPGKGTRFRLLFPPSDDDPAVEQEHVPAPVPGEGGGRRVLVVDDEPSLARWTGVVLERWGYLSSIFTDARAALQAFNLEPEAFCAVVTDQTMPEMTGVELTRALLAVRPGLKVILLTGFSDRVNAETAWKHGIRRFFHKPVQIERLLAALREA